MKKWHVQCVARWFWTVPKIAWTAVKNYAGVKNAWTVGSRYVPRENDAKSATEGTGVIHTLSETLRNA